MFSRLPVNACRQGADIGGPCMTPFASRRQVVCFQQMINKGPAIANIFSTIGQQLPTTYRQVIFQVKDFLEYQKKSNNYYQLKKLIEFFSDKEYRSLVTIPEVALTKGKQNCWVGRVWISEELFRYSHPFILPNLITKKLTKHEVEVQFKVI